MKISVIFSPVTKVSCGEGRHQRAPPPPGKGAGLAARGGAHLRLVHLQQHRPGGEAAVIEQHVRQDGQPPGGAVQGPGLGLQGLLRAGGARGGSVRGRGARRAREVGGEMAAGHGMAGAPAARPPYTRVTGEGPAGLDKAGGEA